MVRGKKCKIFVSYSRHDEAIVKPLAGLLGVASDDALFLDVNSLKPGNPWEQKLVGAIHECSVFVLCWCCQSATSEFVGREISIALDDESKRLVPVLFCDAELPPKMAARQWIDLRGRVKHKCKAWLHRQSEKQAAMLGNREDDREAGAPDSRGGEPIKHDLEALQSGLDVETIAAKIASYFEGLRK